MLASDTHAARSIQRQPQMPQLMQGQLSMPSHTQWGVSMPGQVQDLSSPRFVATEQRLGGAADQERRKRCGRRAEDAPVRRYV